MSDQPNEMVPRVTVRDDDDAMLIMFALKEYMYGRIDEMAELANRPGTDQYKLSMQMIEETELVTGLMRAVDAGIARDSATPDDTEEQDNGTDS